MQDLIRVAAVQFGPVQENLRTQTELERMVLSVWFRFSQW
jgi:hypothetical protein